ncbi:MAG TPA: glycosyltransferase family 2 protein [Roseomonas sp.]
MRAHARLAAMAINRARLFVRARPGLKRRLLPIIRPLLPLLRARGVGMTPRQYRRWIARFDALSAADRAAIGRQIAALPDCPVFSVVMPAYGTPEHFLRQAIASVQAQLYPHWELCIADDASPTPTVARVLAEAAAADPRIRWIRRPVNGHISAASNSALGLARGAWVVLMDHDDLLAPEALHELAVAIAAHPDVQVIYSDEDKVDGAGRRYGPYFKPDFDPDLLLGQNMISHLGAYRRDLLDRIGGFREGFEGSQDHDLALRATAACGPAAVRHIPRVLYHWRQDAGPASFSESSLERCILASRRAVTEHLAGQGVAATVSAAPLAALHSRVAFPLPAPAPLVSVIVPTRDRAPLLRACLDGVLRRTDYPAIEVLVADNGSVEPATFALFEALREDPRVRILPMPGPFNYSHLNNRAAAEARGEVLVLLNNDIDVIGPDWLGEMVSQAVRPGVGAVGAKLLYADGRLQHGGILLGLGWPTGVAGHFATGAPGGDAGPFGWLALLRGASAVTGACLAVRREVFNAVGGLDEVNLPVAFNDVDFCLRLREAGYRNLWTPFAELHHLESASRGDDHGRGNAERASREMIYMHARWGALLHEDPHWNPNLSLVSGGMDLAGTPRRDKSWAGFLAGGT